MMVTRTTRKYLVDISAVVHEKSADIRIVFTARLNQWWRITGIVQQIGVGERVRLGMVDIRAVLLYLSPDRDMFAGIKKAFSVAAASIASNAKASAVQVAGV